MVCSLHFSTPTSLLRGKDFSGFFSPMIDSAVNSFLSTLGCVCQEEEESVSPRGREEGGGGGGRGGATCSCSPLPSVLLMMRRMRPFLSSATRSVTIPRTSMFCRPPSRPHVSAIFSSTRKCTLDGEDVIFWVGRDTPATRLPARVFVCALPLHIDGRREHFGDLGSLLSCGGHDRLPL